MARSPLAIAAFDIDDCLMPVNRPATEEVRLGLRELTEAGVHVIFASGKPCLYLSGLARGLALMECSLIGENGAEIWVGGTMPPQRLQVDLTAGEIGALAAVKAEVRARYGDRVFFQPNTVGVTGFPVSGGLAPSDLAREIQTALPPSVTRYVHVDSVDWAVTRFNKGESLERLRTHLGVAKSRVAAVGDSANDLPMVKVAALGLWVGNPDDVRDLGHVECYTSMEAALKRLKSFVGC